MRSFFAISLALITGCGDNLSGEPVEPQGDNGDLAGAVEDDGIIPRLIPEVCASRAWPEALVEAKDSDLAVVQMTHGAAVLAVPKTGGDLRGFLVDGRGLIMGDSLGMKVIGGKFTGVSATVADGRLIVGLVDGSNVAVNVVRDDLGDFRSLATVPGSFVGDATVMHARGNRVTATGGATGMMMSTFDSAWAPMGSELLARSVPTGMTTTAYGNDAMVAWTTESECHLQRVASNIHSEQGFPCKAGRLAVDYGSRSGQLVYEAGEDILLSNILVSSHNEIANQLFLATGGKSPRIAFDGQRFWVSYINIHNDIVVGYLDDKNNLVSTAIEGVRPMQDAYELAFVNGGVWLYAVDETGFNASRLCLTRQ